MDISSYDDHLLSVVIHRAIHNSILDIEYEVTLHVPKPPLSPLSPITLKIHFSSLERTHVRYFTIQIDSKSPFTLNSNNCTIRSIRDAANLSS